VSEPRDESSTDAHVNIDPAYSNGAGPPIGDFNPTGSAEAPSPLDRPEVAVGAAFAGGLLLAILLKKGRN
jgi:hypothetical protein